MKLRTIPHKAMKHATIPPAKRSLERISSAVLAFFLAVSGTGSLSGCGSLQGRLEARDLLADKDYPAIQTNADLTGSGADAIMDFSVRMFQEELTKGKANTLLSPVSALYALSMTANGARNHTLAQMEEVFGMPVGELNEYLSSYLQALPSSEKSRLHLADSLWLKDSEELQINEEFLQTAAGYYDASVYQAAFDDQTMEDINLWVKDHTNGMIPEILSEIPEDAVLYLINALSFDAEWADPYIEQACSEDLFTCEGGDTINAVFMHSQEHQYLESEHATGFLKYYHNADYAFAALLPEEDMTVSEYADTLTGETLLELLRQPQDIPVNVSLPKFETECSTELSDVLKSMGMTDAFDSSAADLSGMGSSQDGPLYISKVLHKTFLTLDEQGTKAGAATAVEMESGSSAGDPQEQKEVILNRPFLYLIIDCTANLPLFIGTADTVTEI